MQFFSFIGLGNMGYEMVKHLIREKNTHVNIFDINKKIYNKFRQTNVFKLEHIQDLPKNTNFFITMVPDGKALEKIILGKNGISRIAKKGSVIIDCSSIDYATTIKISSRLKKLGIGYLDAPVSGGVSGAKKASLTIMVGGESKTFKKSKPVLSLMGKNIIYVGKSGTGQIIKSCNNMMLGINMIGICEAYILSKKFGIDKKKFFDICSNSTGSSWAMLNPLPIKGLVKNSAANDDFKKGYAAKLINKDLRISQSLAADSKTKTFLGRKAKNIYDDFCRSDNKYLDYSAIINYIEKL